MGRPTCYRCRRPAESCLCPREEAMPVRTKFVLLMHPKEWRREKCATGRLAALNLAGAEILPGLAFDEDPRLRELLGDPAYFPVLLYPGPGAYDLSGGGFPRELLGGRRLLVLLVDATWSCSKTVLRASPGLLSLPRLAFSPREPSRFLIKRQPEPWCLSTIEACHELLLSLEAAGLDDYPDKERLLGSFRAMQDYQLERQALAGKPRYRSRAG